MANALMEQYLPAGATRDKYATMKQDKFYSDIQGQAKQANALMQQEDPKKVEKKPSKEKPTKLTLEVITRIKTLRTRGMSYAKIGKALSLSQATVYKVINP
jgi:DNA invertase Pin-like site-specific DNA recombinase